MAGALANEGRLSAWLAASVAWGAGMIGKIAGAESDYPLGAITK